MPDQTAPSVSPLSTTALALLGEGATASDLTERFRAEGAVLDEQRAAGLLEELSGLGLARIGAAGSNGARYVPTSLGQSVLDGSLSSHSELADRLADIERLRTDLLSTIAHELRTPLTAVRTAVGLLLEPTARPSEDDRATLLRTIERNGERMQRLVGDLLDLARFRAGRIRLQARRFDATALARSVIGSVTPLADARRQRLELVAPPGPLPIFGDHGRLEQALLNLVSNAQKFSPDGGLIQVSVGAAAGEVSWTVDDQGPGIPEADQARLFERFFVGRNDRSEAMAGTGLGLPTALAIAQAHGGRIEVDSRLGAGSTFRLVVPVEGPAGAQD